MKRSWVDSDRGPRRVFTTVPDAEGRAGFASAKDLQARVCLSLISMDRNYPQMLWGGPEVVVAEVLAKYEYAGMAGAGEEGVAPSRRDLPGAG